MAAPPDPASAASPESAATGPAADAGEPSLDLVQLARATDGDADLQRELLVLFDRQSASLLAQLSDPSIAARRRADAAHQLRGSALAVGAGAVARAAAGLETALAADAANLQAVETTLAALAAAVAAARAAIAQLSA